MDRFCGRAGFRYLWFHQPSADPNRSASGAEHHRWFQIGEFTNAAGTVFHGDINRFYAGDGTAGMFMSGFFPIMMFGLPGAALAMYFAAPKERRPMVGGMLLSVAVTAFLTGVTEPLEFLFMFLAPLLYLLHALLTGISLFVATLLGIHAGFSFSAGLSTTR